MNIILTLLPSHFIHNISYMNCTMCDSRNISGREIVNVVNRTNQHIEGGDNIPPDFVTMLIDVIVTKYIKRTENGYIDKLFNSIQWVMYSFGGMPLSSVRQLCGRISTVWKHYFCFVLNLPDRLWTAFLNIPNVAEHELYRSPTYEMQSITRKRICILMNIEQLNPALAQIFNLAVKSTDLYLSLQTCMTDNFIHLW